MIATTLLLIASAQVGIAMAADNVFYSVVAGVSALAVSGNWTGIAAAVLGGAVGNTVAHLGRSK